VVRLAGFLFLFLGCSGAVVDGETNTEAGPDSAYVFEAGDGNQPIFPSCADGVKNGAESDIDCGGSECPLCKVSSACVRNEDCDGSVCTAGKCTLAKTCAELKRASIKNAVYKLDVDGEELPFYCDLSTDGGGWTLAFKLSSGVGAQPAAMWTSSSALNEEDTTILNASKSTKNYVSRIVTKLWNLRFNVDDVRVSMMIGGKEVKFFKFDGRGSSVVNWFVPARLITTSYTDAGPTMTTNHFSIAGDPGAHREWFISKAYGGCEVDSGWMVVDWAPDPCAWESANPAVRILFAPGTTATTWSVSPSRADAMLVFVR
jgi:hypothetical protein